LFGAVRVAKDGRRLDVSISETPIRDAQGRTIGVSEIVRDATERWRAEQQDDTTDQPIWRWRKTWRTAPRWR
jgi:hypothetical protein